MGGILSYDETKAQQFHGPTSVAVSRRMNTRSVVIGGDVGHGYPSLFARCFVGLWVAFLHVCLSLQLLCPAAFSSMFSSDHHI